MDLAPGTTVEFGGHLLGSPAVRIGGTGQVERAGAELDDPNRGVVRYDLSSNDVALPGLFYVQWTLTPPNSSLVQSFPEDGYECFLVLPSA